MKNLSSIKIVRGLMLFLATLGIILSAYLTYEYYQPEPITCPFSASGVNECELVRQSPYSELFGVKLPVWGTIYYIFFAGFVFFGLIDKIKHKYYSLAIFVLATWGFLFESYMTYVQIFKIEAICKWCTLVEILAIAIFIIALSEQIQNLINKRQANTEKSVGNSKVKTKD